MSTGRSRREFLSTGLTKPAYLRYRCAFERAAPSRLTRSGRTEPRARDDGHCDIADVSPLGRSPAGARWIIPITGGRFEGPRLKGIIMPGGEDAQFDRADGVTVFEARYWLQTDDGAVIAVVNRAPQRQTYLRTQPTFEAPTGPHDWLNRAIFVGTLALGGPKQVLRYSR